MWKIRQITEIIENVPPTGPGNKIKFVQNDKIGANWFVWSHSVLLIKGSYPDQTLPQHESLYPIGLISARIKIPHGGNFFTK